MAPICISDHDRSFSAYTRDLPLRFDTPHGGSWPQVCSKASVGGEPEDARWERQQGERHPLPPRVQGELGRVCLFSVGIKALIGSCSGAGRGGGPAVLGCAAHFQSAEEGGEAEGGAPSPGSGQDLLCGA